MLDIIMEGCEGVMPNGVEYDNASTVNRELVCPVRGGGLLLSPTPNRLLKGAMTKEEFIKGYARRSGLTVEELAALGNYVEPCSCGDDSCQGWQMLFRNNYIQNVANTTLRGHENTKVIYTSGRVKWRTQ